MHGHLAGGRAREDEGPLDDQRPTLSIGDDDAVRAIFRKERPVRIREAAKPERRSKGGRESKATAKTGFVGADGTSQTREGAFWTLSTAAKDEAA